MRYTKVTNSYARLNISGGYNCLLSYSTTVHCLVGVITLPTGDDRYRSNVIHYMEYCVLERHPYRLVVLHCFSGPLTPPQTYSLNLKFLQFGITSVLVQKF
jgi:hypothetical protein